MPDSSAPVARVFRAVRDAFAAAGPWRAEGPMLRVAVALSGGRDSMALLDAVASLASELRCVVSAAHVHHGLSPHADAWAAFCAAECTARAVPLSVHRVEVARGGGRSLEATARAARYAALATVAADVIALAHHADDQAETLLLQLLRGAGPAGLAAMPAYRTTQTGPGLLRPFLLLPRAATEAYARARGVRWIEDESNADEGVKRNFLRRDVAPRLAAAFPGYPATLGRAAELQAEAGRLQDDLAELDARGLVESDSTAGMTLERAALIALSGHAPHRARNLLRWFLRQHGLSAPSAARLAAMLDQLTCAPADARVRLVHAGAEVGFHRGRIIVHPPAVAPFAVAWRGESALVLTHGTLEFTWCAGAGIAGEALEDNAVTVRSRIGGERLRPAPGRPSRSLKRLLQEAAMPAWERESLPLVFCGDALAAAPGIGVDAAFHARAGGTGCEVKWHPDRRKG
jgi:tRNA(Ile)-lysidine synthase